MENKKETPLIVHKALQPYLNLQGELFEKINKGDSLLRFKDKDPTSSFYFFITGYVINQGKLNLSIDFKPYVENSLDNTKISVSSGSVQSYFNQWLSLINEYNNIETVFDDPILNQYEKEYEEAEILDEDAAYTFFNQKQQLFLDGYLDDVIKAITAYNISSENKEEADILIGEAKQLKENLTKKTKKETIQALNRIWARARKIGLDVIKEVFLSAVADLVKYGLFCLASGSLISG